MSRLTFNKRGQIVGKGLKYHNKITEVDGIKFHSKMEADRWRELRLLEKAGKIKELQRQVKRKLILYDVKGFAHGVNSYTSDFEYLESDILIIEDVKGAETRLFELKWKILHIMFFEELVRGIVVLRLVRNNGVVEDNKYFKRRIR